MPASPDVLPTLKGGVPTLGDVAAVLTRTATLCGQLDQQLNGHPLRAVILFRARLEAARNCAAVDGFLVDPWHLAAVLEGLPPYACASRMAHPRGSALPGPSTCRAKKLGLWGSIARMANVNTILRTYQPTRQSRFWLARSKRAGYANRPISNSRKSWAWITLRDDPGADFTAIP